MLRRWLLALVILSLAPLAPLLQSEAGGSPLSGRYIVVLEDGTPAAPAVASRAAGLGATVESLFAGLNTLVMSLSPRQVARLRNDARVAFVTPDRPVRLLVDEPDDGDGKDGSKKDGSGQRGRKDGTGGTDEPVAPTGVTRIGAASPPRPPDSETSSEETAPSGPRAAVAILDTGISEVPGLNVVGGVDCAPRSALEGLLGTQPSTDDGKGHGTHVAGVVGAKQRSGVVGVSPGTPLYAVRVFNSSGAGNLSGLICGLNWVAENAAEKNIKVANLSLGAEGTDGGDCGANDDDALHAAVCRVTAAGVTVVAAAGNHGKDLANSLPAAYDEVLAVTAMADFDGQPGGRAETAPCNTDAQDDTAALFSAWGTPESPDAEHTIAAPGVCITSTWNDGGTRTISGTSMAAPHVAGLVARCIDAGPCAGLTPAEIIRKLRRQAAGRPADEGFFGDPHRPVDGRYYGYLARAKGY